MQFCHAFAIKLSVAVHLCSADEDDKLSFSSFNIGELGGQMGGGPRVQNGFMHENGFNTLKLVL